MQTFGVYGVGPVEMTTPSNVTATNSVNLGETWTYGGEEYVYVYNAGTLSASPGQYMVMSANSGFSLTVCSVTQFDFPMGVVKHATIPAGQYGWLLTRGFVSGLLGVSNLSFALSDILLPGSQGRFGNFTNQVSFICAQAYQPVGQCLQAAATVGASTGAVFLGYVRLFGT